MAAIATLVVSCNKEKDYAGKEEVSGDKLRFKATAAEVKTTIENGSGNERIVKWAAGDEITIYFDDSSVEAAAIEAGTSTTFEATASASAENYYAVYPKDAASGLTTGDPDVLNVAVPAAQDGAFANANIAVAKTTAAAKSFAFKNATALVKFSVGDGYTKAVFTGNKGESLAGTVPVTFGSADITLGEVVNPAKKIEVTLNGAGEYYFAVLPQTFESGFSITLYKGDVADTPKAVHASRTLARATILNLGRVDEVASITDYFVTPTGSGSGKSWDKAMGPAQLKALLETSSDSDVSNAKAALLDGVTIHMAAGEYYLAGEAAGVVSLSFTNVANPVEISFLGGYPADLAGTTLSGRDTTQYRTVLTGKEDARILTVGDKLNVSFDGISFQDARTPDDQSGALFIKGTSTTVSLKSCRFVNNKNTNSGKSGAAVILAGGGLVAEDCYFAGNYARNAGALYISAAGSEPVTLTRCTFDSNSSANTSGAVQNAKHTNVTFSHCVFKNNEAKSYGGGAFHTSTGAVTAFEDCDFTDNLASGAGTNGRGGAISIENSGEVTCTRCTFTGNTANCGDKSLDGESKSAVSDNTAGGAIILRHAASKITLNDCTFSGNTTPNGCGGAIGSQVAGSSITIGAGTSFIGNTAYFHGGAIMTFGNLTVEGTAANKVAFTDNKTLHTGENKSPGGALWVGKNTTTSISHSTFSGNEAGRESGTTVNYSNGGVARIGAVASFEMSDCELSGNRARNGMCFSLDLGSSSTCKIKDCYFHDNIGRSGAAKNGTSGNFHGGVAQIGTGSIEFEGCTFSNNVAFHGSGAIHQNGGGTTVVCTDCTFTQNSVVDGNGGCITVEKESCLFRAKACIFTGNTITPSTGNRSGGVLRADANSTIEFSDCLFDGNGSVGGGSVYSGSVIALNTQAVLKVDRCLFKNNVAKSRGVIQGGATCIVYLNRTGFFNNHTTDKNNSWGVNTHFGNSIVCMNNVTSYGNSNTGGATSNSVSFNSDGGWLITNSTLIDNTLTAVVRRGGNQRQTVFCNNIIINTHTANNAFALNSSTNVINLGHNLLSCDGTYNNADPVATDLLNWTEASLGGSYSEAWNGSDKYAVYTWNGALTGFTPTTESDVAGAMQDSYPEKDGTHTSITNIGQDFYSWLTEIGNLGMDARGVTRGTPWWPGAYQAN